MLKKSFLNKMGQSKLINVLIPENIIFNMLKEFFLKKLVQSKLKDVPHEDREKIMKMMEKNPELLMKIAEDVQVKIKNGMDQMTATMEVMKMHEAELRKLI